MERGAPTANKFAANARVRQGGGRGKGRGPGPTEGGGVVDLWVDPARNWGGHLSVATTGAQKVR